MKKQLSYLKKFVKKHKIGLTVVGTGVVAKVLSGGGTTQV